MDHIQVLRNYVTTHESISNLFEHGKLISIQEFQYLDKEHVKATAQYIKSLKQQGFSVPEGLEEVNKSDLKRYELTE